MQLNQLASKRPVIVISKNGTATPYTLTVDDYTDLARAVEREGPPKLAVAWCLLQRFGLLYPLYDNLSTFVRAYAQPINPQWFSAGARHLAEVKRLKDSTLVARENTQASQREGWAKTPLGSISSSTHDVLDSLFAGRAPSPVPLASHYAAPITRRSLAEATKARADFAAKRGYDVIPAGNILTDNWFYGEAPMRGVQVSTGEAAPTHATALASFAIMSGAGFVLRYLLRRFGV
jgi:hypothetical protein